MCVTFGVVTWGRGCKIDNGNNGDKSDNGDVIFEWPLKFYNSNWKKL